MIVSAYVLILRCTDLDALGHTKLADVGSDPIKQMTVNDLVKQITVSDRVKHMTVSDRVKPETMTLMMLMMMMPLMMVTMMMVMIGDGISCDGSFVAGCPHALSPSFVFDPKLFEKQVKGQNQPGQKTENRIVNKKAKRVPNN